MVETSLKERLVEEYHSPYEGLVRKDIDTYEVYQGTTQEAMADLYSALLSPRPMQIESKVYRAYELIKMTLNEKILLDLKGTGKDVFDARQGLELSLELAKTCYRGNRPDAIKRLSEFDFLVNNSNLSAMLSKRIDEKRDVAMMPENPADEDLREAEQILDGVKGKPILAILLGHRGIRRGIDVFLDYQYISQTPESELWAVRYSFKFKDSRPNISLRCDDNLESEVDIIQRKAKGKRIAIIGPIERIQSGKNWFVAKGFSRFSQGEILGIILRPGPVNL